MDRDRNQISREAHELNYVLRKWGKRQTEANRARLVQALDALRADADTPHNRQGFYDFAERTGLKAELEDMGSGDARPARTIADVLAEHGVPDLPVPITPEEIGAMSGDEVRVPFLEALDGALTELIHSRALTESPLWILYEMPGDYGLGTPVDAQQAKARLRELLNTSGCALTLFTDPQSGADAWAGVVPLEETGERLGTSDYWIFKLKRSPFTDANLAAVHKRTGERRCWGFS
ncbi:MAG: hypothetical protein H6739_22410 [Alphaproteobacteria bacterium]|nr:hypothetical protein [Alphaproteobacteria bacterium]